MIKFLQIAAPPLVTALVYSTTLGAGAPPDPLLGNEEKIISPDAAELNQFGRAIAVDGDTAVIGAFRGDGNVTDSGAAYVYVLSVDSWVLQQKLMAPDGGLDDRFGRAVAISGDTVLVGAAEDDDDGTDSGSAYVFTRSGETWSFQQRLTGADVAAEHFFGWAVALEGDTAMVGSIGDAGFTGAVYVFTRSGMTWTEQDKLTADDGAAIDQLGVTLAMDGDTLLATALFSDGAAVNTGAVYVFVLSEGDWVFEDKLFAFDGAENDWFGWSLSLSGESALIGAPDDDHSGLGSAGGAYSFDRSGGSWSAGAKLTAADPQESDRFGWAVAHAVNLALIGARGVDDQAQGSGAVYAFNRPEGTWTEQQKLRPSVGVAFGDFGYSLAIAPDDAFVGAVGDDSQGPDTGAAFVYKAIFDYLTGDGFETAAP